MANRFTVNGSWCGGIIGDNAVVGTVADAMKVAQILAKDRCGTPNHQNGHVWVRREDGTIAGGYAWDWEKFQGVREVTAEEIEDQAKLEKE